MSHLNRLSKAAAAEGARARGGMALRAVFCLAVVYCLLHTSAAFDWQPCSDSSKYADIKNVSLTPEEPAAGDTVKFEVHGTASARQLPLWLAHMLAVTECHEVPGICLQH